MTIFAVSAEPAEGLALLGAMMSVAPFTNMV